MATNDLLKLEGICKTFPAVKALDNVSINIGPGEVRGLVGENGAGKSTLIKIITGAYTKDSGKMFFLGEEIKKNSPLVSKELGVFAVYQDVMVAPDLSVAENFFLGSQPSHAGIIKWGEMYKNANKFLENIGLEIDVKKSIKELSTAEREMIAIAKSLWYEPKLVIFDEPTAVLTRNETRILFNIIRNLKEKGIGIIYISHNLEEVFEICDTVTILKDGSLVGTYKTEELENVDKLIPLMVGREINEMYFRKGSEIGDEILRVEGLSGKKFDNISFNVRSGEIVGLFGLMGSGRTEIARTIFGVDKAESGKIFVKGKEIKITNPNTALSYGIGYLPEDRRKQGIFPQQDIDFNVNIINYDKAMNFGLINHKKAQKNTITFVNKLSIKIGSIFQLISELSGGNQQKVIIARWLSKNSDLLIFDEPTVGIDVGTKAEIYRLFNEILEEKKGIVLISSYLPEIMGLCDRIIVISNGKIAGEVKRKDFSEEYLLTLAMKYVIKNEKIKEAV
ncbi:MAG: sugar ABC transporter ATP-binding protein [Thermotogae bacterium]|nr:MAG: sugar ABC transporter ATP-binding protein [Thermotogota bacterium]